MNSNSPLLNFMSSIGLNLDARGHSIPVDESDNTQSDNVISVLSHYGLLAIEGPDAGKFLQGQTSCDVNAITPETSSPGAYCSPKGRVLSSFLLAKGDSESYLLRMRRSLVEHTASAFSKYIVFSKAEQRNISDDYIVIGIVGPRAKDTITSVFASAPNATYGYINNDGNIAIQVDSDGLMFECWIKQENIETLWPKLSHKLTLLGSNHWEQLTIGLGLGEVCTETIDMFIPQMLNYQIIGAVSFSKGCYTGQEIVARMEYKGKLKRAMYRIQVANDCLQPGTELYIDDGPGSAIGQSVGNIVNAVQTDGNQSVALAVISSGAIEQGNIVVGEEKSAMRILSLPYAITKGNR